MKTYDKKIPDPSPKILDLSIRARIILVLIFIMIIVVLKTQAQIVNEIPIFERGTEAGITIGQASAPKKINYLLTVSDKDKGQFLTWSITSSPTLGTLTGFPAFALSGKNTLTPNANLYYNPTPGHIGNDEFTIQISDGINSTAITITVSLMESAPPDDPGNVDAINQGDASRNVSTVQQWNTVTVPFGTSFNDLDLPATAGVTYVNGEGEALPISWYQSNFNGNVSKDYVLIGDLLLTPESLNDTYKKAQIIISVLPNLSPSNIILSDSILGSWPFEDPEFPPNVFTTNDPDDVVHDYQLVSGDGDSDNCKFSVAFGILIMKDRSYLKEQKKFFIRVRSTDSNNNFVERKFKIYYSPKGSGEEAEEPKEPVAIQVPNAFSPNGDGINDLWIVPGLLGYENVDIKVFDRSGKLMFHTDNPKQGWDGRNPNGKVIAGAYFYIIKVEEINLKKQGVLIVLTN